MIRRLFLLFLASIFITFITNTYAGEQSTIMKADIFVDENGLRHYIRDGLHITLNHTNKDISVTRNETAMFSRQTNEDGTKTYLYFDSNIEENNEYRIVSYSDIFVIIHKNNSDAIQIKHGNISLITWQ